MTPLLEVRDLSIAFRTEHGLIETVRGISYRLEAGEVLGMVGESGCGKTVSTLALMGLIQKPGVITGGSIFYKGEDLRNLSPKHWRQIRGREIAMIFQDPMTSLNPFMTIGAQIREVVELHTALRRRKAKYRVIEVLEQVGLPEAERHLGDYPHQFSGGMRQRVMIAMALAAEPKILLADEPTTALDVTIQDQIMSLLSELQSEEDLSVLLITHDLGVVAGFCDRVMVMYAGRIVERGDTKGLFEEPLHPYTSGLLASVPRLEQPVQELKGIHGQPPRFRELPEGCAFATRCPYVRERCWMKHPAQEEIDGRYVNCFNHTRRRHGYLTPASGKRSS